MNSDGFVALTKCYYCHQDHQILLNTRPHTFNRRVAEAHGKVVDMSPCNQCAEFMKRGIILITIDPAKSEPNWDKPGEGQIPNPYRSGGWFVITEPAFKRIFRDCGNDRATEFGLKYRWMFIEHDVAKQLGLFEAKPTEGTGK